MKQKEHNFQRNDHKPEHIGVGGDSVSRGKTEEMEQQNIKVYNYKEKLSWTDVNSKPADQVYLSLRK